jgi:hypothetical protein
MSSGQPPIFVQLPGGPGTPIGIDQSLGSLGLPGYQIKTSRNQPLPAQLPAWLPASTAWLVEDRIKGRTNGGGQRKGRVLMIFRERRLVAVCSWHLEESGPPALFDLACHPKLNADERAAVEDKMLLAMRCIARRIGRTPVELRFADHPLDRAPKAHSRHWKGEVRERAKALGFTEPVRPRPKFWKGRRWARKRTWTTFP